MLFNRKIKSILNSFFVDYVGFADLREYQNELFKVGGEIVKGYNSGIAIGIAIPNSIVDYLPKRNNMIISCEYKIHGYEVLNQRLNIISSSLTSFLIQNGYKTLPIPSSDRSDQENAQATVSHKMIAHIAGIGWIGKNCLLITKNNGPRVRWTSLLTNAPLKTVNNPIEQQCNDCKECAKACPVKALKAKNYVLGEPREERFDFIKCQNYFNKLTKERVYAVCGMCLYACPHGKSKNVYH